MIYSILNSWVLCLSRTYGVRVLASALIKRSIVREVGVMSTEQQRWEFEIVNGPGEMSLMMSLHGRNRDCPLVTFTVRDSDSTSGTKYDVQITGLKHEPHAEESWWIFEGLIKSSGPIVVITGRYSYKTRRGNATVTWDSSSRVDGAVEAAKAFIEASLELRGEEISEAMGAWEKWYGREYQRGSRIGSICAHITRGFVINSSS